MRAIPVVDLRDYRSGSGAARTRFVETFCSGLGEFGFTVVEGHGIDPELIRRAYAHFEAFFAQREESKRECSGVAGGQRGFTAFGIEIQRELVDSARVLAESLSLPLVFAEGTFLLPGDEDLVGAATDHTELTFDSQAWDEMNLAPADCDVVFAYPWPGEEEMVDRTFARHASAEAILMTFHDFDRVLVQRKLHHQEALRTLGWM